MNSSIVAQKVTQFAIIRIKPVMMVRTGYYGRPIPGV
jgi:hypothetical protein